jgi:uncharacterized membrane protein YbhN (UPF0104 family)
MVSRERLRLVAEHGARLANERRVRVAGQLLLAAGLVFVALRIRSIWHDSHAALGHAAWPPLIAAVALTFVASVGYAFVWLAILRWLGEAPRTIWVGMFFEAQLGKYIPGTVWQYAGRSALARAQGVALRPVATSLSIEFAGLVFGALFFSIFIVGWWGTLAVPIAAGVALLTSRSRRVRASGPAARAFLRALPLYVAVWPLTGVSFWLIGRALLHVPVHDVALYVGAFAAAWLVGVLAFFAPGGLGVREAVLVAILRSKIGVNDAVVLAAVSRALFTVVDVALAGVGALLLRRVGESRTAAVVHPPPGRSR